MFQLDVPNCRSRKVFQEKVIEELPANALPGEVVESSTDCGFGFVHLTNYRIVIIDEQRTAIANIPILSVETVDMLSGDPCGIQVTCKTGRVFRLEVYNEKRVISEKLCYQKSSEVLQ